MTSTKNQLSMAQKLRKARLAVSKLKPREQAELLYRAGIIKESEIEAAAKSIERSKMKRRRHKR